MRVLAALSGGVDSAVAAARAVDAGHDVTGVHLALQRDPASFREGSRGCCSLDDARDARRAADVLGIPFYVLGMADDFERDVVADFLAEYEAGRTPNPCLRCNEKIKFSALLRKAIAMDFDAVCTGHYAQIRQVDGTYELHRADDPRKDQSYVLGVLEQWQLERALFPIGDTDKPQIRAEAERRGLKVAAKPDSHDICFIADGDTAGFLKSRIETRPGEIVDAESGEVLGEHGGAALYTVGQRHGLSIGRPAADGRPRYVLRTDVRQNRVYVGPVEALAVSGIAGRKATWTGETLAPGESVGLQWRAHGTEAPATLTAADAESVALSLAAPIRGVAAGQQAVMYQGTRVVGSFVIESAWR